MASVPRTLKVKRGYGENRYIAVKSVSIGILNIKAIPMFYQPMPDFKEREGFNHEFECRTAKECKEILAERIPRDAYMELINEIPDEY